MMGLFESMFDIIYLSLVVALGIRLLFEKDRLAKIFGSMGVILGLGDAFHLVPRIMSHMAENGFERFVFILSWGQFVTSITMTIFYLLFYNFYKGRTGKRSKLLDIVISTLFGLRIGALFLPQNVWGTGNDPLSIGIIRNVPFAIMGFLLVFLCLREKDSLLKKMGVLILLSFLFYIPVVLFSSTYPWTGAFMLPKTLAYLLLVYSGYREFVSEPKRIHILQQGYVFLIMGLAAGVFYREFTKAFFFTGKTRLSFLHSHLILLGFVLSIAIYLFLERHKEKENLLRFKKPLALWSMGLLLSICMMYLRGIHDVIGEGYKAFNEGMFLGFAGIGHILLSASLVWMSLLFIRLESEKQSM